ncbi:CRISPR-associated endonuclease Cas1 [Myxococcota bacterium]|nr:CRISPR-associated endonuclease Cas1 [Myxococcota bacterium]
MIVARVGDQVADRWNPAELSRVLLFGSAQITTQAIALCMANDVAIAFLSRAGDLRGRIVPAEGGSVFTRLAQFSCFRDPAFSLAIAKQLVGKKLRDARTRVRRHARNHPELATLMDEVAGRLGAAQDAVGRCDGIAELRGIEGSAAAAYFTAFEVMVRPPFTFERRSQHPAHNEVNAMLNFGYTLLVNELAGWLEAAGFDPRIGYYHGIRYGRSSLALDLVEAHRVSVIDALTLSVLNRRMFAPTDFRTGPGGVRFEPAALRRYIALYEAHLSERASDRIGAPRDEIARQVDELRTAVMAGRPPRSSDARADEEPSTEGPEARPVEAEPGIVTPLAARPWAEGQHGPAPATSASLPETSS